MVPNIPWLSLIHWKIVGLVAVILGVWGYGYWGGVNHEREKQLVIAAKQLERALADQKEQHIVSMNVEKANWEATQKIKTTTKTIVRNIRDEKPSSNCNLSNGWVQRHNEASTNTLPKPPRVDYAASAGITADKALEQVAENYGTCYEIREMAVSCQDWIKGQMNVR